MQIFLLLYSLNNRKFILFLILLRMISKKTIVNNRISYYLFNLFQEFKVILNRIIIFNRLCNFLNS